MKSVIRRLSLALAFLFVAVPSVVFGQSYCPQALMGQMNGSYYYNCQACADMAECSMVHVATDTSYDCAGCCGGCCGGAMPDCAQIIDASFLLAPATAIKSTAAAKAPAATAPAAKAPAPKSPDDFEVICVNCKQTSFADFSPALGFQRPGKQVTVTKYKLVVHIQGKGDFFFHCVEAVHSDYPKATLRIGQQLDGDAAAPDGVQTLTADRVKGNRHTHRLKVRADSRHFDVQSVNDLGTQ
jgi:hypothetical protein